jgi:V/A-type H+/Na+-transporting ATPase subunit G/H
LILDYFYLTIAPRKTGQRDYTLYVQNCAFLSEAQFLTGALHVVRRESVNEKHIQQVLEIEKKAQEVQEQAQREAQELPRAAEQEAQALIAKAKAEAQEEARKILAEAQAEDRAKDILADVERQNGELEAKANANLDKAVAYVLERVIGKA